MKCIATTVLLCVLPAIALGQSCAPGSVPPIEAKEDETKTDGNDLLRKQCAPLAFERFNSPDFQPKKIGFYHSAEWGEVARVDVGNPNAPKYWRFVCFQKDKDAKLRTAVYDLKTGGCIDAQSHGGYWTIYPPLSH